MDLSMEDQNNGVPPSQAVTETESTRFVLDEKAAVNGFAVGGGGEAAVGGVDGEQGGVKAESKVGRKRGRPKKHQVDKKATLPVFRDFSAPPAKLVQKRGRGRPRGSGKLQILSSLGGFSVDTAGGNFIPHAVTIQTGEDIVGKILSYAQKGSQSVCVLSATGVVSSVDICQPGCFTNTLRYEGRFDIITLTGSYAYSETGGLCRKVGMLSVSLAKTDGGVFGGAVTGSLIAAGPIQLILASFKQSIKKQIQRRHNAKSSTAAGMPGNSGTSTSDVEKSCVTPTSPLPEPPHAERETIINDQNTNHASLQSVVGNARLVSPQRVDGNASHSSEPILDKNMNHASLQSVDGNGLQSFEPMSNQNMNHAIPQSVDGNVLHSSEPILDKNMNHASLHSVDGNGLQSSEPMSDQNMNCASLHNVDGNGLQSLEPMSDQNMNCASLQSVDGNSLHSSEPMSVQNMNCDSLQSVDGNGLQSSEPMSDQNMNCASLQRVDGNSLHSPEPMSDQNMNHASLQSVDGNDLYSEPILDKNMNQASLHSVDGNGLQSSEPMSDQNMNCASLQSVYGNSLHSSEPMSDQNMNHVPLQSVDGMSDQNTSDINGGVPDM